MHHASPSLSPSLSKVGELCQDVGKGEEIRKRLMLHSSTWGSRSATAAKLGVEAKRKATKALPSDGKWAPPRVPHLQAVGDKAVGQ